jgi:ABC-2 type transport system permease protein
VNGFVRLSLVELRRAVDTRGPRWAFGIAAVVGVGLGFVRGRPAPQFVDFVGVAGLMLPLLMGLLAVMTFTADWSNRSALVTFALVPQRNRLLVARYVVVLVLAFATLVSIHVLAAIVYLVARPGAAGTILTGAVGAQFGSMAAMTLAATLTAVAVAGLILRTTIAVLVAAFAPFALALTIVFLPAWTAWFDPYAFATWLTAPHARWLTVDETIGVGPALSSFLVWTAAPLALGHLRQLRAEPR